MIIMFLFMWHLPSSTIDWNIKNHKDIPLKKRNSEELSHIEGLDEEGNN